MKKLKLKLTPAQNDFLQLPFPKIFSGGVGAGKTTAGVIQALRMPPNTRGCVIAPTYPMIRDVVAVAFTTLARHAIVKYDRAHQEIQLKGERIVLLRSAMLPDRLRGLNLDWLWIDEATYVSEEVFLVSIARLRKDPVAWWLSCTPRRPSWVYDRFIAEPSANTVAAATHSNIYLPKEFSESLRRMYDSRLAQREVLAEWIELGGGLIDSSWITVRDGLQFEPGAYAVMGIDLAAGMGESADYTAIAVLTIAGTGKLQVDVAMRGKWSFAEQLELASSLCEAHEVRAVVVESNAYQVVFAQELAKRGYRVVPYQARLPKRDRIATLAPLYEMGLIQHAKRFADLEAELIGYPDTPHDDLLDALVYAVYAARRGNTANAFSQNLRVKTRERIL